MNVALTSTIVGEGKAIHHTNAAAGMLLTGVGPPACEPSQLQSGLDDPVTYCCL